MPEAKRTLVKSVPELWAEVADPACLGRHLAAFGAVRITRTDPDALVAWEGELGAGTVRLVPSGFGTRVILVAEPAAIEAPAPPPAPPLSLWSRLLRRRPEPVVVPEPEPAVPEATVLVVLTDMLDALGRANHRPFSRA
jgi:hypothetical protein